MSDPEVSPSERPRSSAADPIPDRAARRPWWKHLLVAAAFVAWLGVLLILFLLGRRGGAM